MGVGGPRGGGFCLCGGWGAGCVVGLGGLVGVVGGRVPCLLRSVPVGVSTGKGHPYIRAGCRAGGPKVCNLSIYIMFSWV